MKSRGLSVIPEGFEPSTYALEVRCSIQLSYGTIFFKTYGKVLVGVAGFEPAASCSQSRRDNRATLHPVANWKRRVRDSNPWYSSPYACLANKSFRPLRQLSKLKEHALFCGCKCNTSLYFSQLFLKFF